MQWATVGLPFEPRRPAPRSSGVVPLAFPAVIVKPSSAADAVTVEPAVTTW
jgi:hypothetical protein